MGKINKKNIIAMLGISLLFSSCSLKSDSQDIESLYFDSLAVKYIKLKNESNKQIKNISENNNLNFVTCNYVDSLILANEILEFTNFDNKEIILPDSFFTEKSSIFDEIIYFDIFQMKNIEQERGKLKLKPFIELSYDVKCYLVDNQILKKRLISEDISIYSLGKLNYSALFDTQFLFVETKNKGINFYDSFLLVNTKEKKIMSISEIGKYSYSKGFSYMLRTRTNRKYFFVQTELISTHVVDEITPIEDMVVVPKNVEYYTQFYFDENGYVKFVEE